MLDAWSLFRFCFGLVWAVWMGVGVKGQDTDATCLEQFGWVSRVIGICMLLLCNVKTAVADLCFSVFEL